MALREMTRGAESPLLGFQSCCPKLKRLWPCSLFVEAIFETRPKAAPPSILHMIRLIILRGRKFVQGNGSRLSFSSGVREQAPISNERS